MFARWKLRYLKDPKSKISNLPSKEDLRHVLAGIAQVLDKADKAVEKSKGNGSERDRGGGK